MTGALGRARGWLDRAATPVRILGVAWLGSVLYAYPGYLPNAAVDELIDARTGNVTDWHSPVLTELWRVLDVVASGPAPMLVVQSLLLVVGAYHLLRRALAPRPAAIAAGLLAWWPPVLAITAVIRPEPLLAAFVLAGAAALASPRRAVQVAGLGLLLLACGLRDGGGLAVLPIVLAGFTWRSGARPEDPGLTGWRRRLTAFAVWLGLIAGAAGLVHVLVPEPSGRNELALASRDIAGVLRFARPADHAQLAKALDGAPIVATAAPADARRWYAHPDQLTYGERRLFDPPTTPDARAAIIAARAALIRAHPGAYLHHRWIVLARLIGLKKLVPKPTAYTTFIETNQQAEIARFKARPSAVQELAITAMRTVDTSFVFRPMWYLALAVIGLVIAVIRRRHLATALLASALGYTGVLLFATIDPDRGDAHWLIVATLLALVVLVADAIAARARRAPATRADPTTTPPAPA